MVTESWTAGGVKQYSKKSSKTRLLSLPLGDGADLMAVPVFNDGEQLSPQVIETGISEKDKRILDLEGQCAASFKLAAQLQNSAVGSAKREADATARLQALEERHRNHVAVSQRLNLANKTHHEQLIEKAQELRKMTEAKDELKRLVEDMKGTTANQTCECQHFAVAVPDTIDADAFSKTTANLERAENEIRELKEQIKAERKVRGFEAEQAQIDTQSVRDDCEQLRAELRQARSDFIQRDEAFLREQAARLHAEGRLRHWTALPGRVEDSRHATLPPTPASVEDVSIK